MPGITAPQRERRSRKPTCLPNPPMIVLAGAEKTGKSSEAAKATASDLLGMTYWIEIGGSEGTADYYGRIPGANYEIVEHDGSYQDILDAVRWAVAQPPAVEGKRNMIVVDNVSVLWDMLSDEQALYARWRAEKKAHDNRRRGPNPDLPVTVDPDLWNRAKDRWGEILWHLRRHSGPTLLLARQELVTAFENDKPTRDKTRKIKAEKNLAASVDAIVELHGIGEAYLTGVRTLEWQATPGETERFNDFSIDALLRRMGYENAAPHRQVTEARPHAYLDEQQAAPQGQPQNQPQRRQDAAPATRGPQAPTLDGPAAVKLIHAALTNENNPKECLRAIREEWGIRYLDTIPTVTKAWGEMSANALITRSLHHIEGLAQQRAGEAGSAPSAGRTPADTPGVPPQAPNGQDQAREHQAHGAEPAGEQDAPPPPDPEAEEPPSGESADDTSAAEEPQAPPAAASQQRTGRPKRADRGMAIALKSFHAEAEIQARIKMMTKGEHLGPISAEGEPSMVALRDFLWAQRPGICAQLEEEGFADLAASYRRAPQVDTKIEERFAPYFSSAPAGQ